MTLSKSGFYPKRALRPVCGTRDSAIGIAAIQSVIAQKAKNQRRFKTIFALQYSRLKNLHLFGTSFTRKASARTARAFRRKKHVKTHSAKLFLNGDWERVKYLLKLSVIGSSTLAHQANVRLAES